MKKILYLTFESYGKQMILESQVMALIRQILADHKEEYEFTLLTIEDEYVKKDLGIKHIQIISKNKYFRFLKTALRIIKISKGYNLIHVRSYGPMFPALIAKLLFRKRVIFDMRGLLPEESLLRGKSENIYKVLKYFERKFCKYSDDIVVVSYPFKNYLIEKYKLEPGKISVISTFGKNGSIASSTNNYLKKEVFKSEDIDILVYSGSFEKWQCVHEVISFFKILSNGNSRFRFVFFTPHVDEFHVALSGELPREKYYVTKVQNSELSNYLSQCDYGVLFRKEHIINKVASPIKFCDYVCCGLPVVLSSNIGDWSDITTRKEMGIVMEELNEEQYIKVAKLLSNNKIAFNKNAIKEKAGEFLLIDTASQKYVALYNKEELVDD